MENLILNENITIKCSIKILDINSFAQKQRGEMYQLVFIFHTVSFQHLRGGQKWSKL